MYKLLVIGIFDTIESCVNKWLYTNKISAIEQWKSNKDND